MRLAYIKKIATTIAVSFIGVAGVSVANTSGSSSSSAASSPLSAALTTTPGAPASTDISIAQQPLEVKSGAAPNVMLLIDDSASMVNEYLLVNTPASETYSLDISGYTSVTPNPSATNNAFPPDDEQFPGKGYWRFRNHEFNAIYYNPNIRYRAWAGNIPGTSTPYPDMETLGVGQAMMGPNSGTIVDLTQEFDFEGRFLNPCNGEFAMGPNGLSAQQSAGCHLIAVPSSFEVSTDFYIPHYYTWNKSSSTDTTVDMNEKGQRVEIRPGRTYSRGSTRDDCSNPAACTYEEEMANFANWYTYYRSRLRAAQAVVGQTVAPLAGINVGIASIHAADNDGTRTYPDAPEERLPVGSVREQLDQGHKKAILDQLYQMDTQGFTPLRQALYRTGRYFECQADNMFNFGTSAPGAANCPLANQSNGGNCQQNFTILLTDGFWTGGRDFCLGAGTGGSCTSLSDENYDKNSPFGGVYNSYVFGDDYPDSLTDVATLADVAMFFYGRDLHPALDDNVPISQRDRATQNIPSTQTGMHQHMKTFTVGFGVGGKKVSLRNGEPVLPGGQWPDVSLAPNTNKLDDLIHAAFNSRATYASASQPDHLMRELEDIFKNIAAVEGAGGAPATNGSDLTDESRIYRATYDLAEARGDLRAFSALVANQQLRENLLWSAGSNLGYRQSVFTADALKDAPAQRQIQFTYPNLNAEQQQAVSSDQVEYIKGDQSQEGGGGSLREREGLLGTVINSSTVFIGPPGKDYSLSGYSSFKTTNAAREPMLAIGANDGMLHLFREDDGETIFSYIPSWLIQNNSDDKKLERFTSTGFSHEYYVDMTPTVEDAFTGGSWKTILAGGMGLGGRGFFALDVTNPAPSANNTRLQWEFDHEDDEGVGYSNGQALIARVNKTNTAGNVWVAIYPNGFNSDTGEVSLFVIPLESNLDSTWNDGTDYIKITTSLSGGSSVAADVTQAGSKNGLGAITGYDSNQDGVIDYVYGGDLDGQLWRFDLSSSDWSSWDATRIFVAEYQASATGSSAGTSSNVRQPLINPPFAIAHPDTGVNDPTDAHKSPMIIVGSGSWIKVGDSADVASTHSIYGILDDLTGTGSARVKKADLQQRNWPIFDHPTYGQVRYFKKPSSNHCGSSGTGSTDPFCINYASAKGWYVNLKGYPGERAARNFTYYNRLVSGATLIPKVSLKCGESIPGSFVRFSFLTGGPDPLYGSQMDLNNDGLFDVGDNLTEGVVAGVYLNRALSKTANLGNYSIASQGNTLFSMANPPEGEPIRPGRLSWRELGIDDDLN